MFIVIIFRGPFKCYIMLFSFEKLSHPRKGSSRIVIIFTRVHRVLWG